MRRASVALVFCAGFMASGAGFAGSDAPARGSVVVGMEGGLSFYSDRDLVDIYGPNTITKGSPKGALLGVSLSYVVSENFLVGILVEPLVMKSYSDILNLNPPMTLDTWTADGLGVLGQARVILPSFGGTRFALSLGIGRYSLRGASAARGSPMGVHNEYKLKGSALGGELGIQFIRPIYYRIAMTGTAGYRVARISPVKVIGSPACETVVGGRLMNADGTKAAFDLSGLFARIGISFHFDGPFSPSAAF